MLLTTLDNSIPTEKHISSDGNLLIEGENLCVLQTLCANGFTNKVALDALDAQGLINWSNTGNPRKIIYATDYDKKRMQNIWEFKDPQHPLYPTQKNSEMLELIINTSSQTDSIVLDCFCGSGTTLVAARKLGRHGLGVDESTTAIRVCKERLGETDGLFDEYRYIKM